MMHFPIFIDLSEKNILVVGAGKIAGRRIRTLCGFAGHITVVAPRISEEIEALAQDYPITFFKRVFREADLEGTDLVLAATDDAERNREVWRLCRKQSITVNVCSDQTLCDFQFPSVVQTGEVVIGINASGKNHRLVKEIRKKTEKLFEEEEIQSKYIF